MRTLCIILVSVLLAGCQYDPYADQFVTTQPKQDDVAGNYLLTQQTITTNGLSVLQGRQCQLDLLANNSFSVTNYPSWTNGQLASFISTTGKWSCNVVGTVSGTNGGLGNWGVVFSGADSEVDSLALTGKGAPYGLIMTYGDPDSGTVMVFAKQKKSP